MLTEHVRVQDVLINVCTALHEDYVACTGQVRNHKALFASYPLTAATLNVCIQDCRSADVSILHTRLVMVPRCLLRRRCPNFYVYTGDILLVRNVLHDPISHQV